MRNRYEISDGIARIGLERKDGSVRCQALVDETAVKREPISHEGFTPLAVYTKSATCQLCAQPHFGKGYCRHHHYEFVKFGKIPTEDEKLTSLEAGKERTREALRKWWASLPTEERERRKAIALPSQWEKPDKIKYPPLEELLEHKRRRKITPLATRLGVTAPAIFAHIARELRRKQKSETSQAYEDSAD